MAESSARIADDAHWRVRARDLSKVYRVFGNPLDRLTAGIAPGRARQQTVTALSGVSLDVARGERLGIVGENGSGKSTLLEVIAGTTAPTSGDVHVAGRVAALLELGAGFEPDFSGRENVRINAALLGASAREVQARLPDIEAFAAIGSFLDLPVRTYSSGMYARLAFATSLAFDPDVLLVDELLAVGDEPFQRKCLARLEALAARGCSILVASHNSELVVEFCDRALLLAGGRALMLGEPKAVVAEYHRRASVGSGADARQAAPEATPAAREADFDAALVAESTTEYARRGAVISAPRILDERGSAVNLLRHGRRYSYTYRVTFTLPARRVEFGSMIKSVNGVGLGGILVPIEGEVAAGRTCEVRIPFVCRVLPGVYFLNAGVRGLVGDEFRYLHRILDAIAFRVRAEVRPRLSGMVDFGTAEAGHVVWLDAG